MDVSIIVKSRDILPKLREGLTRVALSSKPTEHRKQRGKVRSVVQASPKKKRHALDYGSKNPPSDCSPLLHRSVWTDMSANEEGLFRHFPHPIRTLSGTFNSDGFNLFSKKGVMTTRKNKNKFWRSFITIQKQKRPNHQCLCRQLLRKVGGDLPFFLSLAKRLAVISFCFSFD